MATRPRTDTSPELRDFGTWYDCRAVDCHYTYLALAGPLLRDVGIELANINGRPTWTVAKRMVKK